MRSEYYRFTLPVVEGEIHDPAQALATLRATVRQWNANRRAIGGEDSPRLYLQVKYRGPRMGQRYNTPRDAAYAADVYLNRRRDA